MMLAENHSIQGDAFAVYIKKGVVLAKKGYLLIH